MGQVDNTHCSGAKLRKNFIGANRLANPIGEHLGSKSRRRLFKETVVFFVRGEERSDIVVQLTVAGAALIQEVDAVLRFAL